jgi:hypothetical protein
MHCDLRGPADPAEAHAREAGYTRHVGDHEDAQRIGENRGPCSDFFTD